jgi:hypothetical protein
MLHNGSMLCQHVLRHSGVSVHIAQPHVGCCGTCKSISGTSVILLNLWYLCYCAGKNPSSGRVQTASAVINASASDSYCGPQCSTVLSQHGTALQVSGCHSTCWHTKNIDLKTSSLHTALCLLVFLVGYKGRRNPTSWPYTPTRRI